MRLALIGVFAMACRAAPIPEAARYPATLFESQYIEVDDTRIHYIDVGRGSPVVFLHGLGASIYSWRHTIPQIAEAGFRVIALDHRGFGSSEKPEDGYSNGDYVALTLALLDTLNIEEAVLVGHSMGGQIAAEVSLAAPSRVRGLALLAPSGFGIRFPIALRVQRWPLIGPIVAGLRNRWFTRVILRSTFANPDRVSEADVDQYYAPVAEPAYGRALRGVLREFHFDALRGRADSIDTPTLMLWGERDRWIPISLGRELAAHLPRVAFFVVPNAGHNLQEEGPETTNRLLLTFLSEGLPRIPENLVRGRNLTSSLALPNLMMYR
jgi:pimeloyl-ACP methyl ester carboxylesterase